MTSRWGLWPDLLPVIALTALGIAITQSESETAWGTILVPAGTVWVYWWRRAPLVAAVGIAAGMVLTGIPTFDQTRCGYILPGALLILFSLGQREERDRALTGLAAIEAWV